MPGIPQEIALIGSADLICEYLEVAISSILFQRGVYAPEEYKLQEFYDLNLFVLDSARGSYMKERLRSLKDGIAQGAVTRVSLILKSKLTRETLECWTFNVDSHKGQRDNGGKVHLTRKQMKVFKMEIGDVLRQMLASVAALPRLGEDTYSKVAVSHDGSILHGDLRPARPNEFVIQNVQKIEFNASKIGWYEVKTAVKYKTPQGFASFA